MISCREYVTFFRIADETEQGGSGPQQKSVRGEHQWQMLSNFQSVCNKKTENCVYFRFCSELVVYNFQQ